MEPIRGKYLRLNARHFIVSGESKSKGSKLRILGAFFIMFHGFSDSAEVVQVKKAHLSIRLFRLPNQLMRSMAAEVL